jgi:hypothetical protein
MMINMQRISLLVMLAVGVVCTSCRTPLTPASSEYSEIAEALFRHLAQPAPMNDPDSHGINLVHRVYFLQVDSQDPSPSFLSRLKDLNVPVKPLSAGVHRDFYWYDKTGQRAAVFYIQNVKLIGQSKAEADGDTSPGGPLQGSGFTYFLARKAGNWVIVAKKVRWIS